MLIFLLGTPRGPLRCLSPSMTGGPCALFVLGCSQEGRGGCDAATPPGHGFQHQASR